MGQLFLSNSMQFSVPRCQKSEFHTLLIGFVQQVIYIQCFMFIIALKSTGDGFVVAGEMEEKHAA